MQTSNTKGIIVFIIICSLIILLLVAFITLILYRYQKKQSAYFKNLNHLKDTHQNTLLQSQLEIQEQTFQNISREIHDSIGQKLTLAKLNLNTLNLNILKGQTAKIHTAIDMIGEAISDLSDISRSMSSELVLQNGLIKALEFEVSQLLKLGIYKIDLTVSNNTIFLDAHSELVLFRIVQEALNNVVKHSSATQINICIDFANKFLILKIKDNGKGFHLGNQIVRGIGLKNMDNRAKMLGGKCLIASAEGQGTIIIIEIPLNEAKKTV